jgi:uncharacterized membrane protein
VASPGTTPENADMMINGARVFGLGVVMLALVCLVFGEFDFGQSVPKDLAFRSVLAYVAAAFMLVAGAALQWRRTVAAGAAALTIYFGLVVVVLMDARVIVAHYAEYGIYSSVAAQLAIAAGALVVYAANARLDAPRAARLTRVGQVTFGICAVSFGGAHFFYMNLTAPLVPKWLPPGQEFWGYATGIFHIAAGLAIATRIQARLAAILLAVMYASFTPLVHVPLALANPADHYTWSENALNVLLAAVAWVVAESLPRLADRQRASYAATP